MKTIELNSHELIDIEGGIAFWLATAAAFGCGFSIGSGNVVGAIISCGAVGSYIEDNYF